VVTPDLGRYRHHRRITKRRHRALVTTTTLFHCSDLHFGHPAVPEQYEAIETLIQERTYDVVAIFGRPVPAGSRRRVPEARAFIRHAERVSKVIAVPGNHDVAWWSSPCDLGNDDALLWKYRQYIISDVEAGPAPAGCGIVDSTPRTGDPTALTWTRATFRSWVTWARKQIERLRAILSDVSPAERASCSAPQSGEGRAVAASRTQAHPPHPRAVRRDEG